MLVRGISATPEIVAPATFVQWSKAESLGSVGMPSSLAACQLMVENIEPVSIMPTADRVFPNAWRCMGTPMSPPGSDMLGKWCCAIRTPCLPDPEARPASLKCWMERTLSRSKSNLSRNFLPSMPWMTLCKERLAICACTKPVTGTALRVPMGWPPSKRTSSRSRDMPILRPSMLHVLGVMIASSARVVHSKNRTGFSKVPIRMCTTSKPLPNTSSGAGKVFKS
mmetsp:Transcript_30025/g.75854  ORF Transcript_30025/g.75854 Transcript_30025/m.75854 type:complete len:224 (-) Transcript_30025:533-1204(-)